MQRKIAIFEILSKPNKEDEELDERLKASITLHLQSLKTVFKQYFLEFKEKETTFARNHFSTALDVSDILDELQHQFYDLKNDSSARDVFQEMASLSSSVLCANPTHNRVSLSWGQILKHSFL